MCWRRTEYSQKILEEEEVNINVTLKGGKKMQHQIVLSTDIAETGVTIPDVVFVIDTRKTKENKYHESSQMSSPVETFLSKASVLQRQDRAGRVRNGFCFRLYHKSRSGSLCEPRNKLPSTALLRSAAPQVTT
uniref:Helicase C-terminal domain-containing protein n=1 Tax=Hucho hucho TaxID=62062 RepID=A0A4W5N0X5_9TELE